MIIRPAQIEDAPEIAHVHIVAHLQSYKGILPQEHLNSLPYNFRKRLSVWKEIIETGTILFVAESDTGIIGFASFCSARDENFEGFGELSSIYLLDKFKGQKIGWQLLQSGMKELARDFDKAYCWVLENNPTIQFYKKSGAVLSDSTKEFERQGQIFNELAYVWPDLTNFR